MKTKSALEKWKLGFILKSFLALVLYLAAGLFFYNLLINWYHKWVWYGTEPVYLLIHWADENRYLVIFMYLLIGLAVILFFGLRKVFSFLHEVADASGQFYQDGSRLIRLSAPLREIEEQMNQAKLDLVEQQRIAREAEQRKNDLVAYLAHDLKTPITSVIGYLTLLKEEPEISPETRARYTGIALDKAERLENLINEFFDITRFNISKLELTLCRINLTRMLEQTASEFLPVLDEKQMKWQLDLEPGVELLCDPDKLNRVFDNLVQNAVNYSYPDSELFLSLRKNGEQAEMVLKNHGATIPPEKIGRIFEQFFRLDSSRSTKTGGAGLGLAVSKEIVELHGGHIEAASADESITFTVTLPLEGQKIV